MEITETGSWETTYSPSDQKSTIDTAALKNSTELARNKPWDDSIRSSIAMCFTLEDTSLRWKSVDMFM